MIRHGAVERDTLSNEFTRNLRSDILSGRKAPGSYLRLQELSKEYNASLSPIREGLSALITEGFVTPVGQRGYKVAPVSIPGLIDVTRARILVEVTSLREAIRLGGENWETALISAFWRLQKFEERSWGSDEIEGWENRHHTFHETLIAGCESPLMIRFCEISRRVSDRYRRIFLISHEPDRDVAKEHKEIFESTINRDTDIACELLTNHIQRTSDNVLEAMKTS